MKTIEKIAIAGFVLVAVVLAATFSYEIIQNAKGAQSPSLPSPSEDDWIPYNYEQLHFIFKYPPKWYLDVIPYIDPAIAGIQSAGVQLYALDPETIPQKGELPTDYFRIDIMGVALAPGKTFEDWRQDRAFPSNPCTTLSEEPIRVADHDALQVTRECVPGLKSVAIYIVDNDPVNGDRIYSIAGSSFRQPIQEEIYWRIVETFEITQ